MQLTLIVLAVLALSLLKTQIVPSGSNDPLSPERSRSLRGLCALIVVLHHLAQRTASSRLLYSFAFLGYLATAVFFFLSGFGMMKRHMRSFRYQETFLRRRLASLLVPAVPAMLGYAAFRMLSGDTTVISGLPQRLLTGDTLISNGWYVVELLVFCLSFRTVMQLGGRSRAKVLVLSFGFTGLWCLLCMKLGYGTYWYNTAVLFPLGMTFAAFQKDGRRWFRRKEAFLLPGAAVGFAFFFARSCMQMLVFDGSLSAVMTSGTAAVLFVMTLLLLGQRVRLGSPVLNFVGGISYELYLLHGLMMMVFRSRWIYIADEALWAAAVIAASLAAAFVFHHINSAIIAMLREEKAPAAIHANAEPAAEPVRISAQEAA